MARAVSDIQIRFATSDDAGLLLRFIRELAIFERAPDAVVATEGDLIRHGFGSHPRFEAILAFLDGEPAGAALLAGRVPVKDMEIDAAPAPLNRDRGKPRHQPSPDTATTGGLSDVEIFQVQSGPAEPCRKAAVERKPRRACGGPS